MANLCRSYGRKQADDKRKKCHGPFRGECAAESESDAGVHEAGKVKLLLQTYGELDTGAANKWFDLGVRFVFFFLFKCSFNNACVPLVSSLHLTSIPLPITTITFIFNDIYSI